MTVGAADVDSQHAQLCTDALCSDFTDKSCTHLQISTRKSELGTSTAERDGCNLKIIESLTEKDIFTPHLAVSCILCQLDGHHQLEMASTVIVLKRLGQTCHSI